MDSISVSFIKYLTLQLEYNLLEKTSYPKLIERPNPDTMVDIESIYYQAHLVENKALESVGFASGATLIAQKAKAIKDSIREIYCQGSSCYFNF